MRSSFVGKNGKEFSMIKNGLTLLREKEIGFMVIQFVIGLLFYTSGLFGFRLLYYWRYTKNLHECLQNNRELNHTRNLRAERKIATLNIKIKELTKENFDLRKKYKTKNNFNRMGNSCG